jgi:hypothetical protein
MIGKIQKKLFEERNKMMQSIKQLLEERLTKESTSDSQG